MNVFFLDSEIVVLCSSRSILIRICVKVTPDSVSLSEVRYTLTGRASGVLFRNLSVCSSSTVEIEKIN